jgi:hypothetical protein
METPESDTGLDLIKQKIVARLKEQGQTMDLNCEQVHMMAVKIRDDLEKQAAQARDRLQKKLS